MDAQVSTAEPQHSYPQTPWTTSSSQISSHSASKVSSSPTPGRHFSPHIADVPLSTSADAAASQFASHFDLLPFLIPQQHTLYHAQLLHYNKLISPARGGGLQTPPPPTVVSPSHVQTATPRSRSSSKVSLKDSSATKGSAGGGHGNRSLQTSDKNRPVIAAKEVPSSNMPSKQTSDSARHIPHRPIAASHAAAALHSSSVPSTPHQHPREFSFEGREPSPTTTNNHSPRSAYSETNSALPSLRPLPPRFGGCKYETAQINSRRRIPYSVGSERLEKLELRTIKSKLSEDEERKLANDMREVFDGLIPTPAVEANRKKLVNKLETIFNDEWPGHDIKVHLFGSSGNLLCSDDSDVDICITTPWRELEGVCIIADLLARRGMEKVVCISAAKVPIVKIWDPELGLACDMNVNNTLALDNTRMVRTYVDTDPRVRQLAMVVKHWTRRRIVNDAGFGGTLSSYTWICLIIAFLQLRKPPVLPSLHQLPYKLPRPDGTESAFADDVAKIAGYGKQNKSSEAELLFQFFRFYAHEFDYDKHVLSIRTGKLLTKQDKKWHYAINNQLCVEEPFNVGRNLSNTADEYSFRGLHMELRRAFDLISEAKLEEACEQYAYPKEEERVWTRPAAQSRPPVLLRSSSQTHSGRGGRGNHRGGGGRHSNNYHQGNNTSSRRGSSSVPTYDPNMFMQPVNMAQDLQWYQPQFPFQYTQQDLMTQMAYHQENMRQFYVPFLLQQQRMSPGSASGQQQQPSDRSRTNSFDNPPLSAPLRPDLYTLYGMTLAQPFFPQGNTATYGTYPSSPAATNGTSKDFRRPLQRSDATNASSNSASRSHSQPASRSPSGAQPMGGYFGSQPMNSVPNLPPRNVNGMPIPSFMSDDGDHDETPKARVESPKSNDDKCNGVHSKDQSNSTNGQLQPGHAISNGLGLGDIANRSSSPGRRRLSSDTPQTILDRRMRRTSRSPSPSPLGHARTISNGISSAPTASAPLSGSQNKSSTRPLVVNGSGLRTSVTSSPKQPAKTENQPVSEGQPAPGYDNPLMLNGTHLMPYYPVEAMAPQPYAAHDPPAQSISERLPVIVNGSSSPIAPMVPQISDEASSFRERVAMMNAYYYNPQNVAQEGVGNGQSRLSPSVKKMLLLRQPQNNAIVPLDLAITEPRIDASAGSELAHLSPVYETRTPSPTVVRKFDSSLKSGKPAAHSDNTKSSENNKGSRNDTSKTGNKSHDKAHGNESQRQQKGQAKNAQAQRVNGARENGHVRGAKSEDHSWQKAGKGKKKGANGQGPQAQAEQPPKNESERKGG